MGWLLLGAVVFAGWLILSTCMAIPWYFRRMVQIGGYFVVKQLGLLVLMAGFFRLIPYVPVKLVVGIACLLVCWRLATHWLYQMDELVLNARTKLHASLQTDDCLTHFELDFYLRNRRLLVDNPGDVYTRELRKMERHLGSCPGCRFRLRRNEVLWRERADPEES